MQTGRQVKKKMKRGSEIGERVKKLRTALGMNHEQFAKRLRVARPRISEWESGKGVPTAEAYVALGDLARYPENLWFLEQAGINPGLISSIANEIVKGRVPVPLAHKTPEGIEQTQIVVPLPERFIPNPDSTVCLVVDKKSAGLVFDEGDVVVLEPAAEPQDPRPCWDKIVLVEFTAREEEWWNWPTGLFMGRLHCKRYALTDLTYYATVGPFNDSERTWAPGRGESVAIGSWSHPGPSEEPIKGSERARLQEKFEKASARCQELWERARALSSVISETPEMVEAERARSEAAGLVTAAEAREKSDAQDEAKKQAPEELRVWDGCKIIGRVVAWFQSPNEE